MTRCPVVVLHVNNRCNCRCGMCSIWESTDRREMTPEDIERLLPDFLALGVEHVTLTGGEPLMNPQLRRICGLLRGSGVRITLLSTGLLLNRFAADLPGMIDELIVSIDGPREIHDRIRRVPGAFDALAAGVSRLRGIPVAARCTVQRLNCRHLEATARAARDLRLQSISFLAADYESTAFNRGSPLSLIEQSEFALSTEDIEALEIEIDTLLRDHSDFVTEGSEKLRRIANHFRGARISPRCNAPWVSAVVEHDGAVRPCFFHSTFGNAFRDGLSAVLNAEPATTFRSRLNIAANPVCQRCVCSLYRP
jgi:MoaA/NifB/PqqE/SkfB family radical SAM enzyme